APPGATPRALQIGEETTRTNRGGAWETSSAPLQGRQGLENKHQAGACRPGRRYSVDHFPRLYDSGAFWNIVEYVGLSGGTQQENTQTTSQTRCWGTSRSADC